MNVYSSRQRILNRFKYYSFVVLLLAFLPACGNASEASPENVASVTSEFDAFINAVQDSIQEKEFDKAEAIVDSCIAKESQKKPLPYIQDKALYMYSSGQTEILVFTKLHPKTDKQKELMRRLYPWYFDIGLKEGQSIFFMDPLLPSAYYYKAYIATEKKDVLKALQYLEKSLKAWPHYGPAYSEAIYLYIRINHYEKAKAIGEKALKSHLGFVKEHKAAVPPPSRIHRHRRKSIGYSGELLQTVPSNYSQRTQRAPRVAVH